MVKLTLGYLAIRLRGKPHHGARKTENEPAGWTITIRRRVASGTCVRTIGPPVPYPRKWPFQRTAQLDNSIGEDRAAGVTRVGIPMVVARVRSSPL